MFDGDLIHDHIANPSNPAPRLKRIADTIIKPIVSRYNYEVITPYDLGAGVIMNQVIQAIDRADLVIADMTTYNPNVFYETALCHAIGVATVMIRERPEPDVYEKFPFDLNAYRYYDIEVDKPLVAREILLNPISDTINKINNRHFTENPVTNYFREPVTSISPAAGLAQGYYQNFVKPAVQSLIELNPDQTDHLYKFEVNQGTESAPNIVDMGFSIDMRRHTNLNIIIPLNLNFTKADRVNRLKRHCFEASIQLKRRRLNMLARTDSHDKIQLYDCPTAMNVMIESIRKRLGGGQVNQDTEEYKHIEAQEVNRFLHELQEWIKDSNNPESFSRRINILQYDHRSPSDNLIWLRAIWND